jgi:hypothetical protein
MDARIIFWWGLFADAVPDVPGRPERLVTTVTRGKTTLRFYIYTYPEQSEEEFNKEHSGLVDSIVRRFTDQSPMSWQESIAVQRRWLPSLVRHFVGFYFLPNPVYMLQMLVQSVLMLPGFVPLALLVVSPSWLALPAFWLLWIIPSLLYILSPHRVRKWMSNALRKAWTAVRQKRDA